MVERHMALKFKVTYFKDDGLFYIRHKTKNGVVFTQLALKGEMNDAFNQLLKVIKEEAT